MMLLARIDTKYLWMPTDLETCWKIGNNHLASALIPVRTPQTMVLCLKNFNVIEVCFGPSMSIPQGRQKIMKHHIKLLSWFIENEIAAWWCICRVDIARQSFRNDKTNHFRLYTWEFCIKTHGVGEPSFCIHPRIRIAHSPVLHPLCKSRNSPSTPRAMASMWRCVTMSKPVWRRIALM